MPKMILEYKKAVIRKIIETALEIFSTKGYQNLTMDEIAEKLGISKGAIYSYFKSKDDILREIYQTGRQTIQRILHEASECDDAKKIMQTIFDLTTKKYDQNIRIYFDILAIASHDENIKNLLKDDYKKDFEVIHEFIQGLIQKKKIRQDTEPRILAQLFRSTWTGILEQLILDLTIDEIRQNWTNSTSTILEIR